MTDRNSRLQRRIPVSARNRFRPPRAAASVEKTGPDGGASYRRDPYYEEPVASTSKAAIAANPDQYPKPKAFADMRRMPREKRRATASPSSPSRSPLLGQRKLLPSSQTPTNREEAGVNVRRNLFLSETSGFVDEDVTLVQNDGNI